MCTLLAASKQERRCNLQFLHILTCKQYSSLLVAMDKRKLLLMKLELPIL